MCAVLPATRRLRVPRNDFAGSLLVFRRPVFETHSLGHYPSEAVANFRLGRAGTTKISAAARVTAPPQSSATSVPIRDGPSASHHRQPHSPALVALASLPERWRSRQFKLRWGPLNVIRPLDGA